jgi:hypothetical protein
MAVAVVAAVGVSGAGGALAALPQGDPCYDERMVVWLHVCPPAEYQTDDTSTPGWETRTDTRYPGYVRYDDYPSGLPLAVRGEVFAEQVSGTATGPAPTDGGSADMWGVAEYTFVEPPFAVVQPALFAGQVRSRSNDPSGTHTDYTYAAVNVFAASSVTPPATSLTVGAFQYEDNRGCSVAVVAQGTALPAPCATSIPYVKPLG